MAITCRFLTVSQERRQQILRATRSLRRNCARMRASIRRQVSFAMQETLYVSNQLSAIPLPRIASNSEIQNANFRGVTIGNAILGQEGTHNLQNTIQHCGGTSANASTYGATTFGNSTNFEFEAQRMQEEEHILDPPIFIVGNVEVIREYCHSIVRVFPLTCHVKHLATLPLLFGDCTLHSMGPLDFKCSFCKAHLWESECKVERGRVIGKHCCLGGKIHLLPLMSPPLALRDLLCGEDNISKAFRKNIRAYNNSLAFVSLGAQLDNQFTRGGGVYSFRIHGMTYHRVGGLMPNATRADTPRYAQLYVYDTEHELENRLHGMPNLDHNVLETLQAMIHENNPYAIAFQNMRQMMLRNPHTELRMVIKETRVSARQYIVPTSSEVAAILPGLGEESTTGERDIHIFLHNGIVRRISNLHRSYMPMLYVLLFPKGEDGWAKNIPRRINEHSFSTTKKVTQQKYYGYRLQIREDTCACLLRGGRLLQQYIVDAYSSIEESRLLWVRRNQPKLRAEMYQGLADMVNHSDGRQNIIGQEAGRRVVLPSSFTGGPRYMHQLYQDSMAIVRKKGKPDLFITFTCNPKWDEITNALLPGQVAQDRPDLTTRVFYKKHKDMMDLLIKCSLFGKVAGYVSVIEFQKRGLPHAHMLIILENEYKPRDTAHYDKLLCAEFPDSSMFPELHKIVSQCNIHGPCGPFNMAAPCMVDGQCKHRYPRGFSRSTLVDVKGYPTYMRRDDGNNIQVRGNTLDCRWIVPYNPYLSMRYKAHINIEVCSTITAVKYLYKYVYKGHDRATIQLQDTNGVIDEVTKYLDARYVSASEACWRIYEYDMHEEKPDVQRLQVHLPMQNSVVFNDHDVLSDVVNEERNTKTTLTEWFVANQLHEDANRLLYIDFPTEWVWNRDSKSWTRRERGNTIGRIYNISPSAGEKYFLRTLLTVCKACKSFEELRTFGGNIYPTFKAACLARGLLESDEEWVTCLQEAAFQKTGLQLRQLLVVIMVFCEPVYPGQLWEKFSSELCEDILYNLQYMCVDVNVRMSLAKNDALLHVEELLQQYGKQLYDFEGMPTPNRSNARNLRNVPLMEETNFDTFHQAELGHTMQSKLNVCQHQAYEKILEAVYNSNGAVFFLDGPGGSGKTFLYNSILYRLRGENLIALACASSGIAALLLSKGRTAHSRFKIPLDLNATSTCNIKVNSALAEVLKMARLIIWDEAPMTHRHAFEALDKTMRDVMRNDELFGGKIMLFGGDFRQVLPVVLKGSREDIVDAALCRSHIWRHVIVLQLTENMRILQSGSDSSEQEFSKWILAIGNGLQNGNQSDDIVEIPRKMLLPSNSLQSLIHWVYKDLHMTRDYASFFRDRAVLAPKNIEVDEINDIALNMLGGQEREYLSADSVASSTHNSLLFTTEFLNSLNLGGGYPPHRLVLKLNAPIMLLRNLDPRRGLCNGTRLICKHLHTKVIEAEVITGTNIGERVYIPRITFIPTTLDLPFDMRRRQFPIRLAFGMTVNKAQGQTLGTLGLYLATPVFTHGQLYVALSRARSSNAIKVFVKDNGNKEGSNCMSDRVYTTNVVYREVLQMSACAM